MLVYRLYAFLCTQMPSHWKLTVAGQSMSWYRNANQVFHNIYDSVDCSSCYQAGDLKLWWGSKKLL